MKFLVAQNQKRGKGSKQYSNVSVKKNDPSYHFYNIMNPSNKIQCDICKRDISKYTKILANQSDYCIHCFSNLDEYPDTYHVINKLDYPIYDPDWTAQEQLLLFEGLEKHGFGNWSQIADFIGTNKTREDVQSHYSSIYIDSQDFVPNKQILTKRDKSMKLVKKTNPNSTKRNPKENKKTIYQNKHQHQRGSLTVNNQQSSSLKTNANAAQIVGYMPKRGDFEVEYDNDAQLLLAQMQFNDDDTEEQKQMKFKLMDIYNQKLTQRIRRKEFVISRKLLDLKQQTRLDKTRSKQQKQIYNMMKVFARFNTPQQHQKLVSGIIRQKQIRQRIQQLKQFKKKGFRTLAQIQQQLEIKRKKDQKAKSKKHQQSSGYFIQNYDSKNTRRSRKQTPIERNEKRTAYINQQEQQICQKFNLSSKQYMFIKETILRESVKQGILQRDQITKIFDMDRSIVDGVFDFLVEREDIIAK